MFLQTSEVNVWEWDTEMEGETYFIAVLSWLASQLSLQAVLPDWVDDFQPKAHKNNVIEYVYQG